LPKNCGKPKYNKNLTPPNVRTLVL